METVDSVDAQVESLQRVLWLFVSKYLNSLPRTSLSNCDIEFLNTPLTTPHGLSWCKGEAVFSDNYNLLAVVERRQYSIMAQGKDVFFEVVEHLREKEYDYDNSACEVLYFELEPKELGYLDFLSGKHEEDIYLEVHFKEEQEKDAA